MTAEAKKFMADNKITVASKFVPLSQSRNAKEKSPTLNWVVTLLRDGREILTTDYSAGMAHCPSYNAKPPHDWDRPARMFQSMVCAWECENGFRASYFFGQFKKRDSQTIEPEAASVVYSLIMDSSVLDSGSFEEWANELGYDPDSRKAESIYRACLEIALKLRNGLGEARLAKAQEAFQDF